MPVNIKDVFAFVLLIFVVLYTPQKNLSTYFFRLFLLLDKSLIKVFNIRK